MFVLGIKKVIFTSILGIKNENLFLLLVSFLEKSLFLRHK